MTRVQEQQLSEMDIPEKEKVVVRAIMDLLEREIPHDPDLQARVIATVNYHMQAEGWLG